MENYPDPFDDQIREAMKGHGLTPREEARKAFLEEASTIFPSLKRWKNWYFLPVIILFLAGVVAYFVIDYNQTEKIVGSQQSAVSSQQSAVGGQQSAVGDQQSAVGVQQSAVGGQQSAVGGQQSAVGGQRSAVSGQRSAVSGQQSAVGSEPLAISHSSESTLVDPEPAGSNIYPASDTSEPAPGATFPSFNSSEPDSIRNPLVDNQAERWRVAAGMYYLPELMFNTIEGEKYAHNAGIDAIFYHGLVSIRTGIGISVSKGITRHEVDYNSYLGSYNKLDSVTFDYNETQQRFEPNIFTSSQNVWDTATQSDSSEIIKRYTYLQVPLVLGFDFWKKEKISVGVRIGTIMSVLMKSHQLTGEYDPGENQVIAVNQLTPSQVSLNWQAIGGIAASVALTEVIYLEIEPQARYYYGSIYEKSGNAKKPWSLGIRAALLYKF